MALLQAAEIPLCLRAPLLRGVHPLGAKGNPKQWSFRALTFRESESLQQYHKGECGSKVVGIPRSALKHDH